MELAASGRRCGGWLAQADSHRFHRAVRSWRVGVSRLGLAIKHRAHRSPCDRRFSARVNRQGRGARRRRILRHLSYRQGWRDLCWRLWDADTIRYHLLDQHHTGSGNGNRPLVRAPAQTNTLPFPLNIRLLQAGWKLLFVTNRRYQPDTTKSAEWNRGAYLAEGLSHCGACHTPRNLLGAEESSHAYTGAVIDGWIAPALTDANPAPVPWSQADLFSYLRSGSSALHGTAAGPMSAVVHDGLAKLPDADIQAIATYFADINRSATRAAGSQESIISKAMSTSDLGIRQEPDPDARLYVAACGSCHYNSETPLEARPELALNTALTLPEPTNFIRVVLDGIGIRDGMPGVIMPGFAQALGDADIARLAAYLRRTRTELPAWTNIESKVAAIRRERAASQ